MIKKYQNREWLNKKYSKEISTTKIGKLCGVGSSTIISWMKRFDISRRSRIEGIRLAKANHCSLSKEAIEWLNGELLGDACLFSRSNYSTTVCYSSKYFEYAHYVSNTLNSFGVEQIGKIGKYYVKSHNTGSYIYVYQSRRYIELFFFYKKWYPNGKKIIPKDLKLTPLTLRQFYIGDGYLGHPKDCRPYIVLSTDGFTISDVEWLVKQLIILGFKATRQPSRNGIWISTHSTKDFLDYVGECPVECYKYKFDYGRGEKSSK